MDAGVSWLSFCSVRAPSPGNCVVHIQDGASLQEAPSPMYLEVCLLGVSLRFSQADSQD